MSAKKKNPRKGNASASQKKGFVSLKDGVCHGEVCQLGGQDLGEHLQTREDFVYLNPHLMEAAGFVIYQVVAVRVGATVQEESLSEHLLSSSSPFADCQEDCTLSRKNKIFLRAWPVDKLPFQKFGLVDNVFSQYSLCGGERIEVEKVRERITYAKELLLSQTSAHTVSLDNAFKNYFLRSINDRHVLPGNVLGVQFFGCHHTFTVVAVTPVTPVTAIEEESKSESSMLILPEMAELSLNNTGFLSSEVRLKAEMVLPSNITIETSESETSRNEKLACDTDLHKGLSEAIISNQATMVPPQNSLNSDHCPTPVQATDVSASHDAPLNTSTPVSLRAVSTPLSRASGVMGVTGGTMGLTDTVPRDSSECVYKIGIRTRLMFQTTETDSSKKKPMKTFADIAGLDDVKVQLLKSVKYPLENSTPFSEKCSELLSRGILLSGPPGTGKTLLCDALRHEVKAKCWDIDFSVNLSSAETAADRVAKIFQEACESPPSLIIVDGIHQLCPHTNLNPSDGDLQLSHAIKTGLDCIHQLPIDKMVIVIATTSSIDKMNQSLRRTGQFGTEINVHVPSAADRLQILSLFLGMMHHRLQRFEVESLAENAHGYVGEDLKALCTKAVQIAWKPCSDQQRTPSASPSGQLEGPLDLSGYCVEHSHFHEAMRHVRPSALKEVLVEVPRVAWSDIGGMQKVKDKLMESVDWPLKHPEAFSRFDIKPPKGVLLYGPPGCSKTMVAQALATESGLNFLSVKGPELFSKYVGDSEGAVRQVFRRARAAAPSIIFFDEIDALAVHRKSDSVSTVGDRVLAQLLTEIDGVESLSNVLVLAASNRPDMIDKALMRPGRFDSHVYVPLPDSAARREIFKIRFRKTPVASDVDVEVLVKQTDGYSGAEIVSVCEKAALSALHDNIQATVVCKNHFDMALQMVQPQTELSTVQFFESYHKSRQSANNNVFQFGNP